MNYLYRRIAFYLVAFWAALTINFALPRLMPGHPYDVLLSKYRDQIATNPAYLNQLKTMLGTSNDPMPVQYVHYLRDMLTLHFGVSTSHFPSPVIDVIRATLPWTLLLAGICTILAFVIGTLLGVIVAWRRGGIADTLLPPVTMFTSAFPSFFMGLLLLYLFGLKLGWFPLQHSYSGDTTPGLNLPFIWDVIDHAILPVIVMLLVLVAGWLIGMRNVMINTLAEEFITMAEAKGLSDRRVMLMYAARNAILPNVTGFGIALAYIVGGVVLVETVFSYPGLGLTLTQAAQSSDYGLLQALLLIISLCVLIANFTVDLLYTRLDPRARSG